MAVKSHGVSMPFVIIEADRASFSRCRRQWDFDARTRRNLEPAPAEVAAAGHRLGTDAAEMARDDLAMVPSPSGQKCRACPFREPRRVMIAGQDTHGILSSGYRERPPDILEEGRLGAPPKFRDSEGR